MTESLTVRRKRLLFRSWHRGTREADLVFGSFAECHLNDFDERQLDLYAQLLDEEDPDLWDWLTGFAAAPARHDHDVMALLRAFEYMPRVR